MSDNLASRTWYLRDDPLESLDEEDKLHHKGYVRILLDAVRELSPPFTLGIFGSWGVGKTSIVKDLRNSIVVEKSLPSTTAVYIDVWKYEGDSLRRQFLIDVQEQLKNIKALKSKYDIEAQLYKDIAVEIESEHRFSWRRLKEAAPQLILVALAIVAIFLLFSKLPVNQVWQIALGAVVLTFLFQLFKGISRTVIVQQRVTTTEHGLYSSEQFEKAFTNIINEATRNKKINKVAIIIDNLDRCSSNRIVEVLGVIKTYLEPRSNNKCVFVIPCDDAAIKEQVKAAYEVFTRGEEEENAEEYADEYIRKFFNASIRITPFIEKEMEPYIEVQLGKIRLTENMPDVEVKQLTQMIGSVFQKNPRQIKQFLNNLTSKYLLVKEREAEPYPMIKPDISNNILFLAKVSIIETKFPTMFQHFVADDNLYSKVLESMYTPGENILRDDKLWQFLDFTKHINVQNYKAFFHLKQSPHEAKIPNYDKFWNAVRSGQRDVVSEFFQTADEESNQAQLEEIITQIRDNARNKYTDRSVYIIRVGCAIASILSIENQGQLARAVIGTIVAYPEIRAKLSSLVPTEVFALMPLALSTESHDVIESYIGIYSQEPEVIEGGVNLRLEIAKSIVENLQQPTKPQLEKVRDTTAGFQAINPELLLVISSTDEAKASFISPTLVSKVVQEINNEEIVQFAETEESIHRHAPTVEFVLRCQDLAEGNTATAWGQKLFELLQLAVNENKPQLEVYTHRCIDDSTKLLIKAETSSIDQIAQLFSQRYPQVDENRRMATALTLCVLHNYCTDGQRANIKNLIISDFVWSQPPGNVARFMAVQLDRKFEELPYHAEVFNRLAERVLSKEDEENRQNILFKFLNPDGAKRLDLFIPLLTACIRRPELSVSIPIIKQYNVEFPKGTQGKSLVGPILDETLNPSRGSIPINERKDLLELSIYLKEWHTRQFQTDFDNTLTKLLTADDSSIGQLGIAITELAGRESALSNDRRLKILLNLATSIIERKPQPNDIIMQELALIMEVREHILDDKLRVSVVEYLRELIRPNVPPNYRQQALSHLASFSGLSRDVLEELIPELVGHARSEADPAMKDGIEESILNLRRRNFTLATDLWEDMRGYYQSLLTSLDEVERQRGRSLRQRMGQITRQARTKDSTRGEN